MEALLPYSETAPERSDVDASTGPLILEFGSNGCGICRGASSIIARAMHGVAAPHVRIEDGRGKRLGRSFGVKLWPTIIVLRDGKELARVVRPNSLEQITDVLDQLDG